MVKVHVIELDNPISLLSLSLYSKYTARPLCLVIRRLHTETF